MTACEVGPGRLDKSDARTGLIAASEPGQAYLQRHGKPLNLEIPQKSHMPAVTGSRRAAAIRPFASASPSDRRQPRSRTKFRTGDPPPGSGRRINLGFHPAVVPKLQPTCQPCTVSATVPISMRYKVLKSLQSARAKLAVQRLTAWDNIGSIGSICYIRAQV
jgi:hypothetical protein